MKDKLENSFSDFEVRCLLNPYGAHVDPEKVRRLWDAAESKLDFVAALQADEDLRFGQACGVLSARDFHFIRGMVGAREIKTSSDAGGVLVAHDGFGVIVPNGEGDGTSRVAVFDDEEEINTSALRYFTMLTGRFEIHDYDCSDESPVVARLEGQFNVWYGMGFVIFVRVN